MSSIISAVTGEGLHGPVVPVPGVVNGSDLGLPKELIQLTSSYMSVEDWRTFKEYDMHTKGALVSHEISKWCPDYLERCRTETERLNKLFQKVNYHFDDLTAEEQQDLLRNGEFVTELTIFASRVYPISDEELLIFPTLFPNIKKLTLHECRDITDAGIQALTQFRFLEKVSITTCFAQTFPEIPTLKEVSLHFAFSSIASLAQCPLLESVTLNNLEITTLPDLGSHLNFLSLHGCVDLPHQVIYDCLCKHEKIQTVQLNLTAIEALPPLKALVELRLNNCKALSSEEIDQVLRNNPQLQKLDLSYTAVTSLPLLPALDTLLLISCVQLKHEALFTFLKNSPQLRTVDIRQSDIQDLPVMKNCTRLKLIECTQLSHKILYSVIEQSPSLVDVDISGTQIQGLPILPLCEKLEIRNCQNLTDENAQSILAYPKLRHIDLWNSPLTMEFRKTLRTTFPQATVCG